jgi:formamidopyrimidine-DNA glycosylase
MPELPEVETIKRELAPKIIGRSFTEVELFWQKAVREPSPEEFCKRIAGKRIEGIHRRGKYLILQLSGGKELIIHLKMTGVLLLTPTSQRLQKHTTAIFKLDEGIRLHFLDQRKFGAMWIVDNEDKVIGKLGPEPLGASFTPAVLRQLASKRHLPIKALLCDQHTIAGIGNMYADEALFAARIHPLKAANSLSDTEIGHLHSWIIEVLERGIKHKGASVSTYLRPDGKTGNAHSQFQVAHRRGEKCLFCGSPLSRITIRGRGTYFCPSCQRD